MGRGETERHDWDDNLVTRLHDLYGQGLTSSEIQAAINNEFKTDFTRSAIIGKIHRLNLHKTIKPEATRQRTRTLGSGRPRPPRVPTGRVRITSQKHVFTAFDQPLEQPEAFEEAPGDTACSLMQLDNETCRWPYGEPTTDDFLYCGKRDADLSAGVSYCAHHSRMARDPNRRTMSREERMRRAATARRRIAMSGQHSPTEERESVDGER